MKSDKLNDCVVINPSEKPNASVIWMHGLGADNTDFIDIVPKLRLPKESSTRFVFPNAPIRPITLNGGFPMRAWFDVFGLDIISDIDVKGIEESEHLVNQLIQNEVMNGIPTHKIFLAGFSQGSVMALFTGLRYQKKLGGLISLSGFLPYSPEIALSFSDENKSIPLFLAHGSQDTVIHSSLFELSKNTLIQQGYNVEDHLYSMEHSVCSDEISDLGIWLTKHINNNIIK